MARPFTGDEEALRRARETIRGDCTRERFRQAQAVVLPLDYAMSLADTANAIGVSPGWACQLRRRFIRDPSPGTAVTPGAGGRKLKLMFQDEARFGRISDVRRCWAPKPVRPTCQAMLTHEYTYAYGAVDVCSGELDSLILPHVNTECMQLFLNEISARHPQERIVMVTQWRRLAPKRQAQSPCQHLLAQAATLRTGTQPD